jgi:hypothetical protein
MDVFHKVKVMDQQQIFELLKKEFKSGNEKFFCPKEINMKGKDLYGNTTSELHVKLIKLYAYGYLEQERFFRSVKYRIKPKIARNGLVTVVNPISRNIKNMEEYRKLT